MGLAPGLNIGCGTIRPDGWCNWDVEYWDVREEPLPEFHDIFDYAVCSFMLQELDFHELPDAVDNMLTVLKPGCWLRILVPNMVKAYNAYLTNDRGWFPQDERTGGLDAAFCTYVTWFGTSKSVFTPSYLMEVCGEHRAMFATWGLTWSQHPSIMDLDSRQQEAMIIEVQA